MAPIEAIVAAARKCIGARFRLHGRVAETGLDCVGLAAIAFAPHLRGPVATGYPLRGGTADGIAALIDAAGLFRAGDGVRPGDLQLLATGPFQHHLAILTGAAFIHADAGLRRVVEVPGRPRWPLLAAWRVEGE